MMRVQFTAEFTRAVEATRMLSVPVPKRRRQVEGRYQRAVT